VPARSSKLVTSSKYNWGLDEILRAHAAELHPVYSSMEALPDVLRAEAARLIDFLMAQEIPVPPLERLGSAIPRLQAALAAAHPDRATLEFIAPRFAGWVEQLLPEARAVFLEEFPALAPAARDLGEDGMARLIQATNQDPRVFACVATYAMTNRGIIVAMASLAAEAVRTGRVDLLQSLSASLSIDEMEKSRDAERLPSAMAEVPQALPVTVALAKLNPSSARGACERLKKILAGHPHQAEYLQDFLALVDVLGAQCTGAATSDLPGYYVRHGVEPTRRFVGATVEAARRYGVRAGQALLERRTRAAKEMLP